LLAETIDIKSGQIDTGQVAWNLLWQKIGKLLFEYTSRNLHIAYRMGARETTMGAIDCSGWTAELVSKSMQSINTAYGFSIYDMPTLTPLLRAASAPQIQKIGEKAGFVKAEDIDNSTLSSGTLIGIRRQTGGEWAKERWNQISHVVAFIDHNNQQFISQSECGLGVYLKPYSQWLEHEKSLNSTIYATNPFKLTVLGL
jgi:hypothetical protein